MLIAAAAILVGFIVLIWSADLFVAGAASIAENLGMSPVIIGLTIVSMGTSAPEILVSITATIAGAGTLAIGNVSVWKHNSLAAHIDNDVLAILFGQYIALLIFGEIGYIICKTQFKLFVADMKNGTSVQRATPKMRVSITTEY